MQIFNLWNFTMDADGRSCRFDVNCGQRYLLERGSEEVLRAFLAAFHVEAEAAEWAFDPFCSPYFAFNPAEGPWHQRIPPAWRARVRLKSPPPAPPPTYRGGFRESYAIDETWEASFDRDPREYRERRCVVIADLFDQDWSAFQQYEEHPSVEAVELVQFHPRVLQARFDLGVLAFPDEEQRMQEFLGAIHAKVSSWNYLRSLDLWARVKD